MLCGLYQTSAVEKVLHPILVAFPHAYQFCQGFYFTLMKLSWQTLVGLSVIYQTGQMKRFRQ
jgi:hypothetical protein